MNLYKRYLLGASAALLIAAASAPCADLFIDDFTNPATTIVDNWMKSGADNLTGTVNGGSFTVDNSASRFLGEYIHLFGANKPATFTLSYTLKSIEANEGKIAGVLFCRQTGDSPLGYILTADNNNVLVFKLTNNAGYITPTQIFHKNSVDLNPANNKLTVSKNGSSFHISVNDEFQGSFTDASYNSGDLSLFLSDSTKAIFGKVHVTDEFKPGEDVREIFDDFDDGVIHRYWRQDITSIDGPAPIVNETGGKLRMASVDGSAAYIYRDINLTDFDAMVEVTHISGKLTSPYGFFLRGNNASSQMVKFFIVGGGYYRVEKSGDPLPDLKPNNKIRGGKGHDLGLELTDTLVIRKRDNSNYEFLVNGEPLTFDLGPLGFDVIGIGLLCQQDVSVAFDNFYVKQNYPVTSIRQNNNKQISRAKPQPTTRDRAFYYDMRGRQRYSAATSTSTRAQTRAAGVYVNKNGRDVTVKKGKVTRE